MIFFIFGQKIIIKRFQIKKELQIKSALTLLQKCRKLISMAFLNAEIFELTEFHRLKRNKNQLALLINLNIERYLEKRAVFRQVILWIVEDDYKEIAVQNCRGYISSTC